MVSSSSSSLSSSSALQERSKTRMKHTVRSDVSTLPELPQELIVEVLLRLSAKSILRFRCVSKPWLSLFSDHYFISAHHNHPTRWQDHVSLVLPRNRVLSICSLHSIVEGASSNATRLFHPQWSKWREKEGISGKVLIGSCNGLLCSMISYWAVDEFAVWNPYTKVSRRLQGRERRRGGDLIPNTNGFCLDQSSGDYKLVRIQWRDGHGDGEVHVFSLNKNSWKTVAPPDDCIFGDNETGVYAGGTLNWVVKVERCLWRVASFDPFTDKFRILPQFGSGYEHSGKRPELTTLGGCLCACLHKDVAESGCLTEVWALQKHGAESSWTLLHTIPQKHVTPLHGFNSTLIMSWYSREFLLLDLQQKSSRFHEIRGVSNSHGAKIYLESLASPNGNNSKTPEPPKI